MKHAGVLPSAPESYAPHAATLRIPRSSRPGPVELDRNGHGDARQLAGEPDARLAAQPGPLPERREVTRHLRRIRRRRREQRQGRPASLGQSSCFERERDARKQDAKMEAGACSLPASAVG